jgi:hypothetical protein
MPPTTDRKLRIQFKKSLRKGFVTNAFLDPEIYGFVKQAAEPNESFIVRVDRKQGGSYWFSDRRVLLEDVNDPRELLRYENVRRAHWMFKGGLRNPIMLSRGPSAKREHYDRIEIEVRVGLVVLEGLGQAYVPTLHFFQWISD